MQGLAVSCGSAVVDKQAIRTNRTDETSHPFPVRMSHSPQGFESTPAADAETELRKVIESETTREQ